MTSALSDLCYQTATSLRNNIRSKVVSAREVVEAHLDQIEKINGQINAICTLDPHGVDVCMLWTHTATTMWLA